MDVELIAPEAVRPFGKKGKKNDAQPTRRHLQRGRIT